MLHYSYLGIPKMPQNFIVYKSPHSGDLRNVTVVDDQPYYQSTGQNSGAKNTWLPFVLLRGTKELNVDNLPSIYNKENFASVRSYTKNYLIKFEVSLLASDYKELLKTVVHDTRIPTKETLIVSSRLSGKDSYSENTLQNAGLNEAEIALAKNTVEMALEPEFTSSDTDEINEWLIKQGAHTVAQVLMREKLVQEKNTKTKKTNKSENIYISLSKVSHFQSTGNKYLDRFVNETTWHGKSKQIKP